MIKDRAEQKALFSPLHSLRFTACSTRLPYYLYICIFIGILTSYEHGLLDLFMHTNNGVFIAPVNKNKLYSSDLIIYSQQNYANYNTSSDVQREIISLFRKC